MEHRINDILCEGLALSEELERGQAERPLAMWFQQASQDLSSATLTVILVATGDVARQVALAGLIGDASQLISVRQTAYPGLLEIRLAGDGYSIEVGGGDRLEYDGLPSLLEALKTLESDSDAQKGSESGIWRVSVDSPPERRGLQILLPESLQAIELNASLESVIVSRSHLVIAATGDASNFTLETLPLLRRIISAVGYGLPASTGENLRSAETMRRELSFDSRATFLPLLSVADIDEMFVANGAKALLRTRLLEASIIKRLLMASESLQERYDGDLRALQARRQRDEALSRQDMRPVQRSSHGGDGVRKKLNEKFAALVRLSDERGRRALLPDSIIGKRLAELTEQLRVEDLQQEVDARQINLTLDERYLHQFQQALRKAFKQHFKQDMAVIREGLDRIKGMAEQELESMGEPAILNWQDTSDDELWRKISELLNFEIRYRGTMPRRGFMQRLGEGRRIVFGILMAVSLFGAFFGLNLREFWWVGVLLLLTFVVAVAWSYGKWREEDTSKLKNELQRVREQLLQESRRVVNELLQEKRLRISNFVDQQKNCLQDQLEQLFTSNAARKQAETEKQRERARHRLRQLETQLKNLQSLSPRVSRLKQNTIKVQSDNERDIRDQLLKERSIG